MATFRDNLFTINGVIDTNSTVLDNLNKICTASGCWLGYDVALGKWAITINRAGTSIASFDDSNIIGAINVSGTGITELYNKVSLEFPHRDLKDATDFVELTVPDADRFPNEKDNTLNIKFDIVNDPIQAKALGARELKQSRVDKVIDFRTDYSYVNLKGGDLIDITSEQYGYTNKIFRIVSVEEDDSEEFVISIRALEYDADVYTLTDLEGGSVRTVRSQQTGILPKNINSTLDTIDDVDSGAMLLRLLAGNAVAGLINSVLDFDETDGTVNQSFEFKDANTEALLSNVKAQLASVTVTTPASVCENASFTLTIEADGNQDCDSCLFDVDAIVNSLVNGDYTYTITGISASDINVPLTGTIAVTSGTGSLVITAANDSDSTETMTITVANPSGATVATETVDIVPLKDFTYSVSASPVTVLEGNSSTVTLTTTGIANGTTIPYEITGVGTSRVSTALSGNVTVNSNSATLTVNTTNDSAYTGTQIVTVTFDPDLVDPCGTVGTRSTTINITDDETAPPAPVSRTYVTTPVVWGGTYDGTTGELTGVFVETFAELPEPFAGEGTVQVPTALSVTQGNPSTITVTQTRTISTNQNLGGSAIEVITSFNTVAPLTAITGSKTTVKGYYS